MQILSLVRFKAENIAVEREQSIAALMQAQIQDLLCGNAWLTSERDAWENTATTISADNLRAYSSQGDLEKVKLLLDAGLEVNAKYSRGSSALIEASKDAGE